MINRTLWLFACGKGRILFLLLNARNEWFSVHICHKVLTTMLNLSLSIITIGGISSPGEIVHEPNVICWLKMANLVMGSLSVVYVLGLKKKLLWGEGWLYYPCAQEKIHSQIIFTWSVNTMLDVFDCNSHPWQERVFSKYLGSAIVPRTSVIPGKIVFLACHSLFWRVGVLSMN